MAEYDYSLFLIIRKGNTLENPKKKNKKAYKQHFKWWNCPGSVYICSMEKGKLHACLNDPDPIIKRMDFEARGDERYVLLKFLLMFANDRHVRSSILGVSFFFSAKSLLFACRIFKVIMSSLKF